MQLAKKGEKAIWFGGSLDLEGLNRMQDNSLGAHLGMEFTGYGADWLKARMPVDERTKQPFGRLHGGASVALAETVGSVAGNSVLDPSSHVAVGLEINANHVRPARSGFVEATVRPESLGRSIQVWSIRIEDEDGALVCISRFTVAVIALDRA